MVARKEQLKAILHEQRGELEISTQARIEENHPNKLVKVLGRDSHHRAPNSSYMLVEATICGKTFTFCLSPSGIDMLEVFLQEGGTASRAKIIGQLYPHLSPTQGVIKFNNILTGLRSALHVHAEATVKNVSLKGTDNLMYTLTTYSAEPKSSLSFPSDGDKSLTRKHFPPPIRKEERLVTTVPLIERQSTSFVTPPITPDINRRASQTHDKTPTPPSDFSAEQLARNRLERVYIEAGNLLMSMDRVLFRLIVDKAMNGTPLAPEQVSYEFSPSWDPDKAWKRFNDKLARVRETVKLKGISIIEEKQEDGKVRLTVSYNPQDRKL